MLCAKTSVAYNIHDIHEAVGDDSLTSANKISAYNRSSTRRNTGILKCLIHVTQVLALPADHKNPADQKSS